MVGLFGAVGANLIANGAAELLVKSTPLPPAAIKRAGDLSQMGGSESAPPLGQAAATQPIMPLVGMGAFAALASSVKPAPQVAAPAAGCDSCGGTTVKAPSATVQLGLVALLVLLARKVAG